MRRVFYKKYLFGTASKNKFSKYWTIDAIQLKPIDLKNICKYLGIIICHTIQHFFPKRKKTENSARKLLTSH